MRQMRSAEQRVAMAYEFEDLLNNLRDKKQKSEEQTEAQRMTKLNQILRQSVKAFELNVTGNTVTKYDFIRQELNVSTPNSIDNCSLEIFDGINRLKNELEVIDSANAVIDIASDDPTTLICDLSVKERSRLSASIGASHDAHALSQLNGQLSVGVRNLFGGGEKLDIAADLGLGTATPAGLARKNSLETGNLIADASSGYRGQSSSSGTGWGRSSSIYNMVHNTSNEYSINFSKPRFELPFVGGAKAADSNLLFNDNKSNLLMRAFQQKLDRTRSSSYQEDSLGTTVSLVSSNKQHSLSYHYHLRSLTIPDGTHASGNQAHMNGAGGGNGLAHQVSSAAVADESAMMSTKSSVAYRFVRDTRNHPSIPTKGYLISNETEISGVGGDVDFIKMLSSFNYHWSLPRVTTNVDPPDVTTQVLSILNVGIQTGFVVPWKRKFRMRGNGGGGAAGQGGDRYIRIIDRLIPSGGLQLRGFEHAQIGPRDRGDYVHCDFLLAGGLSLCLPVMSWLYANIFVNVSHCNLLRNLNSVQDLLNTQCASAGVSAIIPFPVGRLEIGYAHPIKTNGNPFSSWFWGFDVQFF